MLHLYHWMGAATFTRLFSVLCVFFAFFFFFPTGLPEAFVIQFHYRTKNRRTYGQLQELRVQH